MSLRSTLARCNFLVLFFSSRRRHTRCLSDWSSDVCSSDLVCRLLLEKKKSSSGTALSMRAGDGSWPSGNALQCGSEMLHDCVVVDDGRHVGLGIGMCVMAV